MSPRALQGVALLAPLLMAPPARAQRPISW